MAPKRASEPIRILVPRFIAVACNTLEVCEKSEDRTLGSMGNGVVIVVLCFVCGCVRLNPDHDERTDLASSPIADLASEAQDLGMADRPQPVDAPSPCTVINEPFEV